MAAVTATPTTENIPGRTVAGANSLRGLRLSQCRLKRWTIVVATTGDTFTYPGGGGKIVDAAWGAVNTSDDIAVTWDAAGTVTFTGTNGSVGFLYLWVTE